MPLPLFLSQFIKYIPDPIVVFGVDGRILECNQLFIKSLRISKDKNELPKSNVLDFIAKNDVERARSDLESALRFGPVGGKIYVLTRADGTEFPAEISVNTVKEKEDVFVIAIYKDVSERIEAQTRLKESELKFRTVADFTYDWEYWRAPDGKFVYCSPSCERITGYTLGEFMENQELITTIIHPEDKQLFIDHLSVQDARENQSIDFRIVTRSGEVRWISHVCQNVSGKDGGSLGRRANNRDISDRKKFEDAQAESEARLKILFEFAPTAYYLHDLDGNIIDGNLAVERLLRAGRKEFIGKNIWDSGFIPKDQYDRVSSLLAKCSKGEPGGPEEIKLLKKDGSVMIVENTIRPVRINDKLLVLGALNDITERKLTEAALRRSEAKYRDIFSASHDAMFLINRENGAIVDANDAAIKMCGYDLQELLKLRAVDLAADPEKALLLINDGEKVIPLAYLRRRDGTPFPAEVTVTHLSDEKANANIVNVRDITGRMKIEAELRRSELLYRNVVEDQADLISRFLPDGKIVFANGAYCECFGNDEVEDGNIFDHAPSEESDQIKRHLASLTPENPTSMNENHAITRHGDTRLVQWIDRGIFGEGGELVEIQSVGRDITELRQTEQALRESERKYRELVENANSIIIKCDANGKLLTFNEYAEYFFGFSRDEVIGKSVYETITPKTESSGRDLGNLVNDIFYNEKVFSSNINENVKKNGERVWIQWTNKPIKDNDGNLTAILSVGTDVTERKHIEQKLRQSKNDWERTFDSVPDLIAILDTEHRIVRVNKSMAQQLQISAESAAGLFCYECAHGAKFPPAFCPHVKTLQDGEEHIAEVHEPLLGGDFVVSSTPLKNEDGQLIGSVHVARDITDRKKIERALTESEAKFRAAFIQASVGMSMLSTEGAYINVNDALCKMLGYSREELIGRSPIDITHPDDVELTRRNIRATINSQSALQHYEKRFVRKDGQILWTLIDNSAVTDEKGNVLYLLGQIQDITARKEAEEMLQLQTRVLKSMNRILEETVSTEDREQLGRKALDIICDLTGSQLGFLDELDDDLNITSTSLNEAGWNECRMPQGHAKGMLNAAPLTRIEKIMLESRKPIIENDFQSSKYRHGAPDGHPFVKSFLGFPVMFKNNIVAFIGLANKKDGKYTEKDWQLAEMLSISIAEAINRFRIKTALSEQKALQKSEERFRGIAERSFDAILTTDLEGKITYCSPAVNKILGFSPEELLNKSPLDLNTFANKEQFSQVLSAMKSGDSTDFFAFQTAKKDGTPVHIEANAYPILKDDKIVGYQAILRDISARVKAQKDLEKSEEKYRELFEISPVGILDVDLQDVFSPIIKKGQMDLIKLKEFIEDPEGYSKFFRSVKIKDANHAALKLFEVDGVEQLTFSFSDFLADANVHPAQTSTVKSLKDKYLEILKGREVEIEAVTSKGKKIRLSLRISIFALGDKKPRTILSLNDTTERYELMKMKDQFISSITHELRTPLLSVVGYLDYIMSGEDGAVPPVIAEHLEIVKRNSLRLKNLTDDLLDLSRIDAGKFKLNLETVDFKEVLNQCVAEAAKILSQKPHTIHASVPDAPISIHCDKVRLAQIIMNLLSNAIKYSPKGGKIDLNISVDNGVLKAATTDEGIGIRREDLQRVFDRFATIQKPIYAKGTGLGLSVTKELVEAHGGRIWADSAGEGKGSTFTFILPLAQN